MPVKTVIYDYKRWVHMMAIYYHVQPPVSDWQLQSSGMFHKYAKSCTKILLHSIYRTLHSFKVLKLSLFCKRWLKLFVRLVPVGRELSLILRLYSTVNRKNYVPANMAGYYIFRKGSVFANTAGYCI